MELMRKTKITIELPTDEYMKSILGSMWSVWSWWQGYEWAEGCGYDNLPESDDAPYIRATILDPDYDEDPDHVITKWLSINDLVEAGNKGFVLCPWVRWDDMDAGDGDIIMQYAMLGQLVYG